MKQLFLIFWMVVLLFACKDKSKSSATGDKFDSDAVLSLFKEIKLPFQIADSLLTDKILETETISPASLSLILPDSIYKKDFGKGIVPRFGAIGKVVVKGAETYLFVKAFAGNKKMVYLIALDKEQAFSAAMPFMDFKNGNEQRSANFDSKYTVTTLVQQKQATTDAVYHKDVYVYNTAGAFTLILTESNSAQLKETNILNPLDTLPSLNKWSGDYVQDKKNIVSFRDGKSNSLLQVFIHFEKEGGSCTGELKGLAKITGANTALFTETISSCEIQFHFSKNSVTMKELNACGSHRDVKCFFEGVYTRKPIKKAIKRSSK